MSVLFVTLSKKTVLEEKEIRCSRKILFCFFFACFYISKKYIIVGHTGGKHIRGSYRITLIKLGKNCKRP